ncbi:MAG TPA: amidohydrolase family protein [Solirubrobacteraceae bacterium]|jgi:L-fuconolactonase|nr:amidohydrolase family protein [Solirubrobacteraceae bacterium]
MLIDAHHHVWSLAVRPQPWTDPFPILARSYDLDDLRPALAACNIDATVVVQTVTVPEETPELLSLAEDEPIIGGVLGWVDLTTTDISDRISRLRSGRGGHYLVGIRHQVQEEPGSGWFEQPAVRDGLRVLAAHNLTYDLIIRSDQLQGAVGLVEAIPELSFVLDHGGNPDIAGEEIESWSQGISELAALPNVAVKLSGLVTRAGHDWNLEQLRPYTDHLLSAFGCSRVLFGSDWPVSLLRCGYEQVLATAEELTGGLSSQERQAVFGSNALSWYRLDATR